MIGKVVGLVVMRRALSFSVVVNDQIPRQPHQPILQVTLFRVVLFQRSINPNENFLSQVLGCVRSRGKTKGQVIDSSRIAVNNLFPGRPIPRATPANQFGSFVGSQSSYSPHFSQPTYLSRVYRPDRRNRDYRLSRRNYDSLKRKVPAKPDVKRTVSLRCGLTAHVPSQTNSLLYTSKPSCSVL